MSGSFQSAVLDLIKLSRKHQADLVKIKTLHSRVEELESILHKVVTMKMVHNQVLDEEDYLQCPICYAKENYSNKTIEHTSECFLLEASKAIGVTLK